MTDTLKRCPFCGSKALLCNEHKTGVICPNEECGLFQELPECDWNTRVPVVSSEITVLSEEKIHEIARLAILTFLPPDMRPEALACKDFTRRDMIDLGHEVAREIHEALPKREASKDGSDKALSIIEAMLRNSTEAEWLAGRGALARQILMAVKHCCNITLIEDWSRK